MTNAKTLLLLQGINQFLDEVNPLIGPAMWRDIFRPLYERLTFLWAACYCAVAVMGLRLLQVQVLENVYYSRAAEGNRTKIIRQTAPRGRIYDRNGEVVATNQAAFSLIYIPPKKGQKTPDQDFLARQLARELGRDPVELLETLQQAVARARARQQPLGRARGWSGPGPAARA